MPVKHKSHLLLFTFILSVISCFGQNTQIPLTHPLIISERIDGPANIREDINGNLQFTLNTNIPVYTSDTSNKWYHIAVSVDLNEKQYQEHLIPKGSKLYAKGVEAGEAMSDIKLYDEDITNEKGHISTILLGYTSMKNIQQQTQPEYILSTLLTAQSTAQTAVTFTQLSDFIKGFQFSETQLGTFSAWQLDANYVYGPSAPLRLLLVFNKGVLAGVVHVRKLGQSSLKDHALEGGYIFSTTEGQDPAIIKKFISQFNTWIKAAG